MKIGIFGGSFNPIHKAHLKIARFAIKELDLDKLIFVPANINPFKSAKQYVSGIDRYNMIKLVLEDKMEVSDFEIKRNGVSYTIDTIKYFAHKYPNDELFFILGSDNLPTLHKWEGISEIAELAKIVVFRRSEKINKTNIKKFNGILLNNPLFDASSTAYKQGNVLIVDEKVQNYIQEHTFYAKELIHNMLSAKRAKHCMSTGNFAAELAKKHGYSARQAYVAGIFHDICKEFNEIEYQWLFEKYQPELLDSNNPLPHYKYHQTAAYLWLKNLYKLQDQDVLRAISIHTSMDSEMQPLDKILFIADKICDGRRFPGIQKVRELCFEDLEKGFATVVQKTYEYNIDKGVKFTPDQLELYNKYRKEGE
ncbi:nicotinate-nucleotide adenylyltransferase [Mycoplasma sp. Pen4]|uniref:nicotinate-nucleotide adenylyltransferase n=1 Tax=Mycoplasma sp. Pen4 TaxID=640330 RepID=UPI001654772D|nr:nicotinate-nucleotide adenylyltransferase [Mycoplasma sp. Pen4]QNM93899.1 nicotinate-nucleotide adenylyltransferase [Mycoplasma sp. Pen4]